MKFNDTEFPLYGEWSPSNSSKIKVRGVLDVNTSKGLTLKIWNLSKEEFNEFESIANVFGILSDGKKITLLKCIISLKKSCDVGGISLINAEFYTDYTVRGAWLTSLDDDMFSRLVLQSETISSWLAEEYLELKSFKDLDDYQEIYSTRFADESFELKVVSSLAKSVGMFSEKSSVSLIIELLKCSDELFSLNEALKIAFPVLYLISMFCDRHHGCYELRLIDPYNSDEITLCFFNSVQHKQERIHPLDTISLHKVKDNLSHALSIFYASFEEYGKLCRLYEQILLFENYNVANVLFGYVRIMEKMMGQSLYAPSPEDCQKIDQAKYIVRSIECVEVRNHCLSSLGASRKKGNKQKLYEYMDNVFPDSEFRDVFQQCLKKAVDIRNTEAHLNGGGGVSYKEGVYMVLAEHLLYVMIKFKLFEILEFSRNFVQGLYDEKLGVFRLVKDEIDSLVYEIAGFES